MHPMAASRHLRHATTLLRLRGTSSTAVALRQLSTVSPDAPQPPAAPSHPSGLTLHGTGTGMGLDIPPSREPLYREVGRLLDELWHASARRVEARAHSTPRPSSIEDLHLRMRAERAVGVHESLLLPDQSHGRVLTQGADGQQQRGHLPLRGGAGDAGRLVAECVPGMEPDGRFVRPTASAASWLAWFTACVVVFTFPSAGLGLPRNWITEHSMIALHVWMFHNRFKVRPGVAFGAQRWDEVLPTSPRGHGCTAPRRYTGVPNPVPPSAARQVDYNIPGDYNGRRMQEQLFERFWEDTTIRIRNAGVSGWAGGKRRSSGPREAAMLLRRLCATDAVAAPR
jgi:hypothetical protein